MKKNTLTLSDDYKALLDFVYQGSPWRNLQKSRLEPHTTYRHIVRALILKHRKPFLLELCKAEGLALNKNTPDHSTILHSKSRFEDEISISWSAYVNKLEMYYTYYLQKDASPIGEGVIEKAQKLITNTPEMNAFLLARCFKAGFIQPKVQDAWMNDYTKVGQPFLEQMLNKTKD